MTGETHSVRISMLAKDRTFRLGDDSLTWQEQGEEGAVMLDRIDEVNLITYAGPDGTYGQCTVFAKPGKPLKLRSHHFRGFGSFEDRSDSYRAFVEALCAKLANRHPPLRFTSGNRAYVVLWVMVLILCALAAFTVLVAFGNGDLSALYAIGGLIPIGTAAIFAMVWIRANRKASFDPEKPPLPQ